MTTGARQATSVYWAYQGSSAIPALSVPERRSVRSCPPLSPAERSSLTVWGAYLASLPGDFSGEDYDLTLAEGIDKIRRRRLIGERVAAVLADFFDLPGDLR